METVEIPNKEKVIAILQRNNVMYAALFGSRVKKSASPDSDYDILVEYSRDDSGGLFELAGMIDELEREVGAKVDIVSKKYIHPLLKKEILRTAKGFYDQRKR